jgi:hypothetical protein
MGRASTWGYTSGMEGLAISLPVFGGLGGSDEDEDGGDEDDDPDPAAPAAAGEEEEDEEDSDSATIVDLESSFERSIVDFDDSPSSDSTLSSLSSFSFTLSSPSSSA